MADKEHICRMFALTERERQAFALWFDGRNTREIGERIGTTTVSAGQLLDKARVHVGEQLDRRRAIRCAGVLRRAVEELDEIRGTLEAARP